MGMNASYHLTIMVPPEAAGTFEKDVTLLRMRKAMPEMKFFIDGEGQATGNDGSWRSIEDDMKAFSLTTPTYLYCIVEKGNYDGPFEYRHYFQDGKSTTLHPVTTWPAFSPELLK